MAPLLLAEELFLLTHDDESGRGSGTYALDSGYAGALLLDLAAGEYVVPKDGDRIAPAGGVIAGHPLLDDTLDALREAPKPKRPDHWVKKLPGELKPLGTRIGQSLAARGVLAHERRKILGLIPTTKWPEVDPAPERELRARLHGVLVKGVEPDLSSGLLIALLSPLDLVKEVVPKGERKAAEQRAKAIAESDLGAAATSAAVRKAVEAVQTAVMVAVIIPAVTATTAGGS